MNHYYVEITCRVNDVDRGELEGLFDSLAEAVYDLHDVTDADLGADLAQSTFDFTMFLDAETDLAALEQGLCAVRTAVHAAGNSTAGWDQHFETIRKSVSAEPAYA